MALKLIPSASRLLTVAGLVLGAAAAQAAGGYTVTQSQEALVTPGMSMDQVQQALGHPEQTIKYRNEPGPTFTYRVMSSDPTLFDVDFGADGRVASVSERMELTGGDGQWSGGHH
ncbi:hypothetical protein [Stenotrophomonas sp. YIM B06876]|uniref:hypothetical protein n=1 Tax=Stenotrophomonas sp. YIM B06876 TaxID=3060211 RepID=UPI002739B966|nr:hypothetical protein [Stenotrophomonas sp. YIM B06876]